MNTPPQETPDPPPQRDQFLALTWECRGCGQHGDVNVWMYPHELPKHTNERHQLDTRGRCVKGCVYQSRVLRRPNGDPVLVPARPEGGQ